MKFWDVLLSGHIHRKFQYGLPCSVYIFIWSFLSCRLGLLLILLLLKLLLEKYSHVSAVRHLVSLKWVKVRSDCSGHVQSHCHISGGGDFTAQLGNLFQCLTTLAVKENILSIVEAVLGSNQESRLFWVISALQKCRMCFKLSE